MDLSPRCPACSAPLTGAPACPRCALPLTGPVATRLWEVDLELGRLEAHRTALLHERAQLLAALRGTTAAAPARPAAEWTPRRVQNLLLALGGGLLAVAALVFSAVAYDRLGVGGRAAVLLTLTAVAGTAAARVLRRELVATAETVAAVALALAVLDAWGLRRLGLGDGLDDVAWLAAASAVLAGLSAAYASVVRLRLPRVAGVVLAHAALVLAVAHAEPGVAAASLLLTAVAGAGVALAAVGRSLRAVPVTAAACAAAVAVPAALLAAVAALDEAPGRGLAVAGLAGLAAGAAAAAPRRLSAVLLAAVPVLLAAAVVAQLRLHGDAPAVVAALVAAATVAVAVAARLPRGLLAGAVVTVGLAAVPVADRAVEAVLGPLTWAADPWSLASGGSAREALSPWQSWDGSWSVPAVALLGAAVVAGAGRAARWPAADAVAAVAAGVGVLALPLALDVPHPAAVLLLLALAAAALAARRDAAAVVAGALAAGWSLADEGTTLVALPVAAVLAAAAAVRVPLAGAAVAGLLLAGETAALGASAGLTAPQVGGLLLLAVGAGTAAAAGLRGELRDGVDVATAATAATAVVLATSDAGWLSWTLAGTGVAALVTALRAERRAAAPAGALLLTAASWVRLADAGVDQPEPYLVPLGLVVLVLGHLRFRRDPCVRSQAAHGPGLALLLGPSALAALAEDGLARPLLLGAAALAVLLVGARTRLQAPLLAGGAALGVVGLDLVAPYAAAVPRWTALAAAGTLLVVVGATFEERRQEVARLRDRVAALR